MILVYAFYPGDQKQALKNVQWWKELGGCKGHDCLVIPDIRSSQEGAIISDLESCFNNVHRFPAHSPVDGWPQGANYFFRLAASWVANHQYRYFFWMEPDAIPMKEGWIDQLDQEFIKCGKPFMGDKVQVGDIPLHMSGVGFYASPLHAFAGEAYRAHEIAWDMAGKDQIVPKAHWTRSIEHAWKHPTFTNESELVTQIRPETLVFHSSKDGSLIDIVRGARQGLVYVGTNPRDGTITKAEPGALPDHRDNTNGVTPSPHPLSVPQQRTPNDDLTHRSVEGKVEVSQPSHKPHEPIIGRRDLRDALDFTCDIFIRTYPGDYKWLTYCLRSIEKYCQGFRKIIVVSPQDPHGDSLLLWRDRLDVEWKVINEEAEDHYLSQQITKLYADVLTDYQADYILHVDSDVVFTQPCRPDDFLAKSAPIWWFTPYSEINTPWKPITEKFTRFRVDFEFMRRFPIMVPRWLYPKLREFCHKSHGMIISEYVRNQPLRAFSEFNALGAYAYQFHRERIYFINTLEVANMPTPFARQFWSVGGITPEIQKELDEILSIPTHAAEQVQETVPSQGGGGSPGTPACVPDGIKQLPNGIWIIAEDTHIGKWVEQQGRVDHDMNTLPFILDLINEGDVVVDAGANIGDHTVAYLKKVKWGTVHAFEPSPVAMACLMHNVAREYPNSYFGHGYSLCVYRAGLGDHHDIVSLVGDANHGAAHLVRSVAGSIDVAPLDFFQIKPDLIKLDIEGYEPYALWGARDTIKAYWPKLVIEVNESALKRNGFTVASIISFLEELGYTYKVMQENCTIISPMFDLIALPPEGRQKKERVSVPVNTDVNDRIVEPLEASISITEHVSALAAHAKKGLEERKYVRKLLYKEGVVIKPKGRR